MFHIRPGRVFAFLFSFAVAGAGIYVARICFLASQHAYGITVAASCSIVAACILFLSVKSRLDEEQEAWAARGRERGRIPCRCEYRDFSGDGGDAVFYENGIAYEIENEHPIGMIPYEKFSHMTQDGNAIMAFMSGSLKAKVLVFEAKSDLKAKAILNLLKAFDVKEED